ncbi:hypothetical protein EJB05_20618 [Eragrostis curvula]|uniref:Uncharacterized protein n=1 Tax=Eragrostis curvula TaxID=38414 RepID=A0A5J9UZM2_9POAL|nr:hypothetical protein EJB05_20618 [Eragrostis curvula]
MCFIISLSSSPNDPPAAARDSPVPTQSPTPADLPHRSRLGAEGCAAPPNEPQPPRSPCLLCFCSMDRGEGRPAGGDGPSASAPGSAPSSESPSSPGIEALAAEAMASDGVGNEESIDAKVQKALECPCLDDLKKALVGAHLLMHFPAISRAPKKRRDQTVSTPSLPCRTASRKIKKHLSRKFWKKKKTTMKLISLTSKFCLQHGPEKPSQRNEVYEKIDQRLLCHYQYYMFPGTFPSFVGFRKTRGMQKPVMKNQDIPQILVL